MEQTAQDPRLQRALRLKATREADEHLIAAIFGPALANAHSIATPASAQAGHAVPAKERVRAPLGG